MFPHWSLPKANNAIRILINGLYIDPCNNKRSRLSECCCWGRRNWVFRIWVFLLIRTKLGSPRRLRINNGASGTSPSTRTCRLGCSTRIILVLLDTRWKWTWRMSDFLCIIQLFRPIVSTSFSTINFGITVFIFNRLNIEWHENHILL